MNKGQTSDLTTGLALMVKNQPYNAYRSGWLVVDDDSKNVQNGSEPTVRNASCWFMQVKNSGSWWPASNNVNIDQVFEYSVIFCDVVITVN